MFPRSPRPDVVTVRRPPASHDERIARELAASYISTPDTSRDAVPLVGVPCRFWFAMLISGVTGLPFCRGLGNGVNLCRFREVAGEVPADPCDRPVHRRVHRGRMAVGIVRLIIFTTLTALTLLSLMGANDAELTAPVVEQARMQMMTEPSEALEGLVEQHFVRAQEEFMTGTDVAQSLFALQSACRKQALQNHSNSKDFKCEIIAIEVVDTAESANPEVPCTDESFIKEAIIVGDLEPYDELPTRLKQIYRKLPAHHDRLEPVFEIAQGWSLFAPLLNTENDIAQKKLGPLPLLSHKLNLLAKGLKIDRSAFRDDPRKMHQASQSARGPNLDSKGPLRNVDRNHHWDVAFHCEPKVISVSFKIVTTRSIMPLWWRYRLTWTLTGRTLNYYRSQLDVKTSIALNAGEPKATWAPLGALTLICVCYAIPVTVAALCMPLTIFRLILGNTLFKSKIRNIIDPCTVRTRFNLWVCVAVENMAIFCSLIGFGVSAYTVFSSNSYSAYYDEVLEEKISPFAFWLAQTSIRKRDIIKHAIHGLWIRNSWHSAGIVFMFIRNIEWTLFFDGTGYILMTFFFSLFPVIHFCIVFAILLLSFATVLFCAFGNAFTQYSSLGRCIWNVLLYAFEFETAKVEDLFNPQMERSAISLQLLLLAFKIIVIVIFLNMFTTIVIDAYGIACERTGDHLKMNRLKAALWYHAKVFFGYVSETAVELKILGGVPGAVFFRLTLPDEKNPLGLAESTEENPYMLAMKMKEALETLQPYLKKMEQETKEKLTAEIENVKVVGEDGSPLRLNLPPASLRRNLTERGGGLGEADKEDSQFTVRGSNRRAGTRQSLSDDEEDIFGEVAEALQVPLLRKRAGKAHEASAHSHRVHDGVGDP